MGRGRGAQGVSVPGRPLDRANRAEGQGMRRLSRTGLRVTVGAVVAGMFTFGVMGASASHAPIPRHGISFQKSCQPTTPVGSLLQCGYTAINNDGFHDTLTIHSITDRVFGSQSAAASTSGELMGELQLVVSGGATCTATGGDGSFGNPYTGATQCTLPFGARVDSFNHGFYTVVPADYDVAANHQITDTATLGFADTCDAGAAGCSQAPITANAGAATIVVREPSIATSVNG